MGRVSRVKLYLLIILVLTAHGLQATTYVVGTCKPRLRSFSNISAALAATPAPDDVQVCPETYPEQVEITQPVTLTGIASGDSEQTIITLPSGGLVNTTLGSGIQFAAQLWVNNANGTGQSAGHNRRRRWDHAPRVLRRHLLPKLFRDDKPGHDSKPVRRRRPGNLGGRRASSPSVTVQNSSVHNFDHTGIYADSFGGGVDLTVKGNAVNNPNGTGVGIGLSQATTAKVTNNVVTGTGYGNSDQPGHRLYIGEHGD